MNEWTQANCVCELQLLRETCKKERNFTVRLQIVKEQAGRHTHAHVVSPAALLVSELVSVGERAWESQSQVYSYDACAAAFALLRHVVFATSAESQLNSPASTPQHVCAGDFDSTCLTSSWARRRQRRSGRAAAIETATQRRSSVAAAALAILLIACCGF